MKSTRLHGDVKDLEPSIAAKVARNLADGEIFVFVNSSIPSGFQKYRISMD